MTRVSELVSDERVSEVSVTRVSEREEIVHYTHQFKRVRRELHGEEITDILREPVQLVVLGNTSHPQQDLRDLLGGRVVAQDDDIAAGLVSRVWCVQQRAATCGRCSYETQRQ